MSGTDTGRRDKRGKATIFAIERVCGCLYILDTHNVRAVFIFYYYILVLFNVIFITRRGSHCKRNREREIKFC